MFRNKYFKKYKLTLLYLVLLIFSPLNTFSQSTNQSSEQPASDYSDSGLSINIQEIPTYPKWDKIFKGFEVSKLSIKSKNYFIKSDLFIIKFNLNRHEIIAVHAPTSLGVKKSNLDKFVKIKNGIAGINANFFDKDEKPLGVLISQTEKLSSIHQGGKLLTGIFQIKNNVPSIIHRNSFQPEMVELAVQSGPILIYKGKPQKIISQDNKSRRSGIAINKKGEVLIFATELRFPGATFKEIQNTLIHSGLDITDALNLDGGGSSQMFFYRDNTKKNEVFISGGDKVPAAIVIKERNKTNES